jgi:pullulanase/glycogen debranching enzyme
MQPLLADPNLKPGKDQILQALANFTEMLRIRQSSTLFRLGTDAQVQSHLSFLNTGPEQIPGVIVMLLKDDGIPDLDPNAEQILVIFNASPEVQTFTSQDFAGREFKLHPIQTASQDPIVRTASFDGASGTFTVPGRTAAVFVAQTMPQAPQTKNSLAIAGLAVLVALWIGLGFSVLGRKGPDEANLE